MEKGTPETPVFNNLEHVGVVVRDIDKTIEYLTSLGIGSPAAMGGRTSVDVPFKGEVRGKPSEWGVKIGRIMIGDIELELLQPLEGESVLKEFLENNGEGLHHIGFKVDNIDAETQKLTAQGVNILMSAKTARGGFAYFETSIFGGVVLELRQLQ